MEPSRKQERQAKLLNLLLLAATLWALGQWLYTPWGRRRAVPLLSVGFNVINLPVTGTLVSVVILTIITRALLARHRAGLWMFIGLQLMGIYISTTAVLDLTPFSLTPRFGDRSTFLDGLDYASLVLGPLLILWALSLRGSYRASRRPGSLASAISALGLGSGLAVAVAAVAARETDHGTLGERIEALIVRGVGGSGGRVDADLLRGIPPIASHAVEWILGATMVAAVVLFVRSRRDPEIWTATAEQGIRQLLAADGHDSLGYFATRRDRSASWNSDHSAAISYRVDSGVCLAAGDPIGPRERWDDAISSWLRTTREYGWIPAVLSCSEEGARAYAHAGLTPLSLGDEAILEPGRFRLNEAAMTPVRHAVSHATRAGLECRIRRQSAIPAQELAQLAQEAEVWRGKEPERGFSMALGRAADPTDPQTIWVTAHRGDALVGLLSFVPWGIDGLSLDLMRRSPDAPSGVNELMVARLMQDCGRLRVRRVSLNFCMFRGVFEDAERIGSAPTARVGGTVLGAMDRFWQLERLYRSNMKYQPTWQHRYLCFDQGATLPQVAWTAARLEGFMPGWLSWPAMVPATPTPAEAQAMTEVAARPRAITMPPGPRRSQETRARLARLETLQAHGLEGYPAGQGGQVVPLRAASGQCRVSARVTRVRDHGGVVFAQLTQDGTDRQVILDGAILGRDQVRVFATTVSIGDLLLLDVTEGSSRNGTPSLIVQRWQLAAKSLHPIPFGGLQDPATRTRQRLLDLIVNDDGMALLRARSRAVTSLRTTLGQHGFLEVETPILGQVQGGANARPFRTHINAYDADLVLRIAPELALKKLLVAGMGPIFEIGRNFRNEGADATHNPEFTSLEAYQPHGDYTSMRLLTQELIRGAAVAVHGEPLMPIGLDRGAQKLERLDGEWPVVKVLEAVSHAVGEQIDQTTPVSALRLLAKQHDVDLPEEFTWGQAVEELYGELVESATTFPTFYIDFPSDTSPLTRPHRTQEGLSERWDLVANGMELGTAYTELTDPLIQRERLTRQSVMAAAGDPEAMSLDEDFLRALELGMPPAGGLGLGVDRIAMSLTGTTIRSVLPFPFVRGL